MTNTPLPTAFQRHTLAAENVHGPESLSELAESRRDRLAEHDAQLGQMIARVTSVCDNTEFGVLSDDGDTCSRCGYPAFSHDY